MNSFRLKRMLTLCLTVCFLCLLTTVVYAEESKEFESLLEKNNLKVIDSKDVPSHITPIKVESLEELDKLFSDFDSGIKRSENQKTRVQVESLPISENGDVGTRAIYVGALEKEAQDLGPCSQMVYVSFNYDTEPYTRFMSVRMVSSYLQGNTTCADYTHIDDWYSIIDAGRTLSVSVTGHAILYADYNKTIVYRETYATNNVEFYRSEI